MTNNISATLKIFDISLEGLSVDQKMEKIKILEPYASRNPGYFLRIIHAIFEDGKDYDVVRWIKKTLVPDVIMSRLLDRVIQAIIS